MTYLAKEKVGSTSIILFNVYFVSFHFISLFLLSHPVESWVEERPLARERHRCAFWSENWSGCEGDVRRGALVGRWGAWSCSQSVAEAEPGHDGKGRVQRAKGRHTRAARLQKLKSLSYWPLKSRCLVQPMTSAACGWMNGLIKHGNGRQRGWLVISACMAGWMVMPKAEMEGTWEELLLPRRWVLGA